MTKTWYPGEGGSPRVIYELGKLILKALDHNSHVLVVAVNPVLFLLQSTGVEHILDRDVGEHGVRGADGGVSLVTVQELVGGVTGPVINLLLLLEQDQRLLSDGQLLLRELPQPFFDV